jgi:cellulose synthase (UDP-forming)
MLRFANGRTARGETLDLGRAGAGLALAFAVPVSHRQRVWLSMFSFDDERPLPAEIVEHDGRAVRVRFVGLDLEEEAHLVRVLFSRADAWIGWTRGHVRDRPLRTLAGIARRGAAGIGRAVALSFRAPPAIVPPRAVRPVRRAS